MRNFVLTAVAALAIAPAADAAVTITSSAWDLAAPAGPGVLVDFDDVALGGFTLNGSGYLIQSGNNSIGAAPAAGPSDATDDPTNYLSVYGGFAKLMGVHGYHDVSLFWGSIDNYNALDLLDASGDVFSTITNGIIPSGGNGDQLAAATNRRVNISSDSAIYGLQFRSTQAALEADNVKFSGLVNHHSDIGSSVGAVPEPASWAMMLGGFGMIGGALRSRRKAAVSFG